MVLVLGKTNKQKNPCICLQLFFKVKSSLICRWLKTKSEDQSLNCRIEELSSLEQLGWSKVGTLEYSGRTHPSFKMFGFRVFWVLCLLQEHNRHSSIVFVTYSERYYDFLESDIEQDFLNRIRTVFCLRCFVINT